MACSSERHRGSPPRSAPGILGGDRNADSVRPRARDRVVVPFDGVLFLGLIIGNLLALYVGHAHRQ